MTIYCDKLKAIRLRLYYCVTNDLEVTTTFSAHYGRGRRNYDVRQWVPKNRQWVVTSRRDVAKSLSYVRSQGANL